MLGVEIILQVKSNRAKQLKNLMHSAMEKSLEKTGEIIRAKAVELAPRDTEALAESIYVGTAQKSDYAERVVAAMIKNIRFAPMPEEIAPRPYGLVVGSSAPYAGFQEFGTVQHGPQPFMTPAAMLLEKTWIEVTIKQVSQDVK